MLLKRELYRREPWTYMQERLGLEPWMVRWSSLPGYAGHEWDGTPDPLLKVLEYLAAWNWVGVESAIGVGKTWLAARIICWFLECWKGATVVITAPKSDQLALHVWRELELLYPKFGLGTLMAKELLMNPTGQDWYATQFVAGVSKSEVDSSASRARGFHAQHQLIMFEDTPGVHQAVMRALRDTSVAPHNLLIAFGNPDHQQDTLHQFCNLKRVKHVRISGFDHPNVVLKNPDIIPGAQTIQGLADLLDAYGGTEHMLYKSRARGISPEQSTDALIRWEWCVNAAAREANEVFPGPKALGADVANSESGDKAARAYGEGSWLKWIKAERCPNANLFGESLWMLMEAEGIKDENAGVDGIGVGAGAVNEILRLGRSVVDIQSGIRNPPPVQPFGRPMVETFDNLRSQMWWIMRLCLQFPERSGLKLPDDKELFADLCSPSYGTRGGVIWVEEKNATRARLGRSPNKGDAAVYWNWVRLGLGKPRKKKSFAIG